MRDCEIGAVSQRFDELRGPTKLPFLLRRDRNSNVALRPGVGELYRTGARVGLSFESDAAGNADSNTCGGHLKEDWLIGDANLGNELVAEFSRSFVDETLHFDVFAQGDEVLVQTFGEILCFTVRQRGIDAYDHHKIVAGVVYESNARIVANEGAQADVGFVFGNGLDHVA